MIRRVVLLVAFAALLPCLAMAGGVSYTTSGTFSNPNLLPITFIGTSITNFAGGDLSFGHFDVVGCSRRRCRGKETFTLQITEISPVSTTADLKGEIFGWVNKKGHSHLTIIFKTATVTIGSTVYNISLNRINLGIKTLNGSVTPSVPEPSAEFLLGMGALGLMGLVTLSRKMINA
jgi:hypothetical protein